MFGFAAAADTDEFVVEGCRDTVAERLWESADGGPVEFRGGCVVIGGGCGSDGIQREREHGFGPDFFASFPWFFIGKVSAAGEEQVVIGDTGKASCEAFRVGDGWQLKQCQGWFCRGGRDWWPEQCECEQGGARQEAFQGGSLLWSWFWVESW